LTDFPLRSLPAHAVAHDFMRRSLRVSTQEQEMTLKRMDNVLIVVDNLEAAKAFFIELGLTLEGETTVEGPLVGRLIGLKDVRATLAMMRTPDGQGIELDKFHTPDAIRFGPVDAPVNTLGIRRIMFAVDGLDAVVARLRGRGHWRNAVRGHVPAGLHPRA
jgi:catechol 2,3-dioxygenase-like lactoylglutathione lyase family enzyme